MNGYEGSQEEDTPPAKRIQTEAMVLDADEVEIASGLRPIQDETRSQDGDSGSNDFDDDGHTVAQKTVPMFGHFV